MKVTRYERGFARGFEEGLEWTVLLFVLVFLVAAFIRLPASHVLLEFAASSHVAPIASAP